MNMIGTPCSKCRENDGCTLWRTKNGDEFTAIGYCKQFAARNKVDPVDLTEFVFDVVIVYDESVHVPSQLIASIEAVRECNKLIVVDVTGEGRSRNTLELLKYLSLKRFAYECLIEKPQLISQAIDHAIKSVISPYFIAIDASMECSGIMSFGASKAFRDTRNVLWKLVCNVNETLVVLRHAYAGVYVSTAFASFSGNKGKSFREKLHDFENVINVDMVGISSITYRIIK